MQTFLLFLKWGPILFHLAMKMVRELEVAIPDEGSGSRKLEVFDGFLKGMIEGSDKIKITFEEIQPVGHNAVRAAVTLLKATGELQRIAAEARAELEAIE